MVLDSDDAVVSVSLDKLAVHSPRALYETYNFHDPHALEALAGWLARPEDNDGPGVAVVAGKAGSGRDYFVQAAAWMAGERDAPVRHVRLSFDGFDPDGSTPLLSFAEHQLRLRLGGREDDTAPVDWKALLTEAAGLLPGGYLGAAAVSVLLNAAISSVDLRTLLRSTVPVFAAPRGPSQDHLRTVLDLVARGGRLVLVLPADELPEPVVQWFVHEPRRLRRLSVVLSTARVPDAPMLYGEPLGPVAELGPMTPAALRERVSLRFAPNQFPDPFFSGLWKRSQGVPGQLALAMITLEHGGWITRDDGAGSPWYLTRDPSSPALVEYFAGHFYEQLNQIRNGQQLMELHLVRFVELAALCGSLAPPRLITSYMGLTDKERDGLVELVDGLEEAGRPVFISLDYQHPTFRGVAGAAELVYRFADESNRLVVLNRMIHKRREAQGLLTYLASRVPVFTRANAELFATLSAYLPEGSEERQEYERCLRWWSDSEEAEAFAAMLSEQVRAGRLSIDALWATVKAREEWTPFRRLALLDAMLAAPDGIPLDDLPYFWEARGMLLGATGRYQEALNAIQAGLRLTSSNGHAVLENLHWEAHRLHSMFEQQEEALWHASEYYRLVSIHGGDSVRVGIAAANLAHALIQHRRNDEADRYLQEALEISARDASGSDWELSVLMNQLGNAFSYSSDHARAAIYNQRALEYRNRLAAARGFRNESDLICYYQVGKSLVAIEHFEEAREYLGEALSLTLEIAGPTHAAYGATLLELVVLDLKCGNEGAAVEWSRRLRSLLGSNEFEMIAFLREKRRKHVASGFDETCAPAEVRELFEMLQGDLPSAAAPAAGL